MVQWRYGLDGEPKRTLAQIGQTFNVTGTQIWNVQMVAVRKLYHAGRRVEDERHKRALERLTELLTGSISGRGRRAA